MLIDNHLFGTDDKVQIAIDRIKQYEPQEGYYVAFSGGKDSCVVLDLVKRAGVKYDAHYNLTTVDPPELVYFIREHHPDVEVHKPKKTMWDLFIRYGPPDSMRRWRCGTLKEAGGNGRTVITGVRWEESFNRSKRQMYEKSYKHKKTFLHAIIDWTMLDIWTYIENTKLPYCSLYDEGYDRVGCIMCPLQAHGAMRKDAERWPKYAAMYRFACNKSFEYKKSKGKKMIWENGDDMFDWWMDVRKQVNKENPGQTTIFVEEGE